MPGLNKRLLFEVQRQSHFGQVWTMNIADPNILESLLFLRYKPSNLLRTVVGRDEVVLNFLAIAVRNGEKLAPMQRSSTHNAQARTSSQN